MTFEQIEKILQQDGAATFEIKFKTRSPMKGFFITTPDYRELSRKNFWRIVSETHIEAYKASANIGLARIFNGAEFTRIVPVS